MLKGDLNKSRSRKGGVRLKNERLEYELRLEDEQREESAWPSSLENRLA
jgi:hypothetical protein